MHVHMLSFQQSIINIVDADKEYKVPFFCARNFVVFGFGHLLHFYLLRYVLQHVFSFYKQVTMMMTIDVGYSELINEK